MTNTTQPGEAKPSPSAGISLGTDIGKGFDAASEMFKFINHALDFIPKIPDQKRKEYQNSFKLYMEAKKKLKDEVNAGVYTNKILDLADVIIDKKKEMNEFVKVWNQYFENGHPLEAQ